MVNYLEKTDQNEKRHKTRFLGNDNWTKKKYFTELEAYSIINSLLNMINVKDNYKNSDIDTKCEDTTEHLLECPILQRLTQEEMKAINLETVDNMQELRRIARYIERVNEIK